VAVRPILRIDNPEELAILKSKSVRVKQFDKSLRTMVDDMIETMRATDGVGIAAPQLGVMRRVVVIETPAEFEELEDGTSKEIKPPQLFVMINPEISDKSEERTVYLEGCLSLPGWYGEVPRAAEVTIRYQDLQGKEHKIKRATSEGYGVGRIAQHEVDHLDGVLFTERIEDLSTLQDRRQERPKRRRFALRRKERATPQAPLPVVPASEGGA
jgi:peptide deformylase